MSESPELLRVLTTRRAPVAAALTAKVGCTFVRNLFYLIDHDEVHAEPLYINNEPRLVYRDMTKEELSHLAAFFLVRNPEDRFFSLYWDKAQEASLRPLPWLIEQLEPLGFLRGQDLTLKDHQRNCNRLLGFIERQFRNKGSSHANEHWRPQEHTALRALQAGLTPLLLEELADQLPQVVRHKLPDIAEKMQRVGRLNESSKQFANSEMRDERIVERIKALYASDFALHAAVRQTWENSSGPDLAALRRTVLGG